MVVLAASACRGDRQSIVLGATTSAYDSGLLEHLIARFNEEHPEVRVRTVIAGSGEALALGRDGNLDLLLVHSPEAEASFVDAGHARERRPVMYNSFVIAGPPGDPAGIRGMSPAAAAFAKIARGGHRFVSRGDSSGTHHREVALWDEAGVAARGGWYAESGQGQGMTLQLASEREAYTLTDGATLSLLSGTVGLEPLAGGDRSLRNVYSLLQPEAALRPATAKALAEWLVSPRGRRAIAEFRHRGREFQLFWPWPPADGAASDDGYGPLSP